MPVHDDLGTRMKEFYEHIPQSKLMRRTPVMIRIDGKAFHTFTKGFARPFDEILIESMQRTMKYLCENIQGCVLGYTQSDEISLVLVDYKRLESSAWFNYEVQKMCSIAASMATMAFNKFFNEIVGVIMMHLHHMELEDICILKEKYGLKDEDLRDSDSEFYNRLDTYQKKMGTAMFDARVFNIPKEEVTNCLYWRQIDAARNSIQMVGQAYFSHNELQNKTNSNIQDMLMEKYGINWNDYDAYKKRGSCSVRNKIVVESNGVTETSYLRDMLKSENEWIIDKDIPMFKGDGRLYVDNLIMIGEK